MKGDLFEYTCPDCGYFDVLTYTSVYLDEDADATALHGGDFGANGLSHPDVESDPIKKKYSRGTKLYHDDYGYGIIVRRICDYGQF